MHIAMMCVGKQTNMVTNSNLTTTSGDLPETTTERKALWRGSDVLFMSIGMIALFGMGIAVVAALSIAGGAQFGTGEVPLAFSLGTLAVQPIAMGIAIWWSVRPLT